MAKCISPECYNHTPLPFITKSGEPVDVSALKWCLRCISKWREHTDSEFVRYNHDYRLRLDHRSASTVEV